MSGDYSRWSHEPGRDFGAVLMQQGRVQTDADWNESATIVQRRLQALGLDTLGRAVVPRETPAGFRIVAAGGSFTIGAGRLYLDGLLAENHGAAPSEWDPRLAELRGTAPTAYADQPCYKNPPALPGGGPHLVYLKVWQREITAIEDPRIVEPALGVDTTTRLQTAWQVKVLPNVGAGVTCLTPLTDIAAFGVAEPAAAGRLSTDTIEVTTEPDKCLVPPGSGYTGLENQLYRVEIHRSGGFGAADRATFKWSRDNGTVASRVSAIPALDRIVVESVGRDSLLRFSDGDWIEITDDFRELNGQPGEMRRIRPGGGVDDATRTILLETNLPAGAFPVDGAGKTTAARNTRVRRWDQRGRVLDGDGNLIVDLDAAGSDGTIPVAASTGVVQLENAIVARFALDPTSGRFRTGDHWVFAARTVDASIEKLVTAPPRAIHAHYAPLAIVTFPNQATDCRVLWPLESLYYLAGDGQEATPQPGLTTLPLPVNPTVGVIRGPAPVAGAQVRFHVEAGSGVLANGTQTQIVTTGGDGIAACGWALDPATQLQRMSARLLDPLGAPTGLPITFSARLRTADVVSYTPTCDDLAGATTVQGAIDVLCKRPSGSGGCCHSVGEEGAEFGTIMEALQVLRERGEEDICLCLLPGRHVFEGEPITGFRTVRIGGAGKGSIIEPQSPIIAQKLEAFTLRDVGVAAEKRDLVLVASGCGFVTVTDAVMENREAPEGSVLVRIEGCRIVRLARCDLSAAVAATQERAIIAESMPRELRQLVDVASSSTEPAQLHAAIRNLMNQPRELRIGIVRDTRDLLASTEGELDLRDRASLEATLKILEGDALPPPSEVAKLHTRLVRVAANLPGAAGVPGALALVFADGRADAWLDDSLVRGDVSLYGNGGRRDPPFSLGSVVAELGTKIPPLPPGGRGRLRLAGNTLDRVVLADEWLDAFDKFAQNGGETDAFAELGPPFLHLVVSTNSFANGPHTFAARAFSASANVFERASLEVVGLAAAATSSVVGNTGPGNGVLFVGAPDRAQVGNVALPVTPL